MKQEHANKISTAMQRVLIPFIFSRLFIFLAIFIGASFNTTLEPKLPENQFNIEVKHPHLNVAGIKENLSNTEKIFLAGDSGWYYGIAKNGYNKEAFNVTSQKNWAFFPLFPLIARALDYLSGNYIYTVLIFNNLLFFLSLSLLYYLAREFKLKDSQALLACYLLAFHPVSYFFSSAFSESLFLYLLLISFYYVKKERIIPAGVSFALLSATRPTGIILLPAFLIAIFLEKYSSKIYFSKTFSLKFFYKKIIALLLAPLGALIYFIYLYKITGDPLSWLKIQSTWRPKAESIWSQLISPLESGIIMTDWNFVYLNCICLLISLYYSLKLVSSKHYSYSLIALLPLTASLLTGSYISIARFSLCFFPVYFCLAKSLTTSSRKKNDRPGLKTYEKAFLFLSISFSLLLILSLLYGASVTGAMT